MLKLLIDHPLNVPWVSFIQIEVNWRAGHEIFPFKLDNNGSDRAQSFV